MKQTVRTTGKAGQISPKANLLRQSKLMNWLGSDFKGNISSLWRIAVLQPVLDILLIPLLIENKFMKESGELKFAINILLIVFMFSYF